jgi:phage gpG-like protein
MSRFGFDKVLKNMEQLKKEIPPVLANQAQTFFTRSFDNQGFTDGSLSKWAERKYGKDAGRNILVKSGRLKRAVSSSIREANWNIIRLIVDVPYAEYHNEGTDKLPKREFMGDSKTLRDMQLKKLQQMSDKIWNNTTEK